MGGKGYALAAARPWVVLKLLQSFGEANLELLQELGHFLLHTISLR
jgi:hypothetical protein